MGKTKQPTYRVVVTDSRNSRDGRFIEAIGRYNPRTEPSEVEIDADKAKHWLSHGAQPSAAVHKLLQITGVLEVPPKKVSKPPRGSVKAPAGETAAR